MSAPESPRYLLERFLEPHYKNGLKLWLDQGQLRFKGPKEILKKELIAALKKHKPDIIMMLQEEAISLKSTSLETALSGSMIQAGETVNHIDAEYPLSMSQSAIWMLYQFAPNSPVYNTTFCARLNESTDIDLLEKAYQNTVNRHDLLRSRFLDSDEGSVQQVMHSSQVSIDLVDGMSWGQETIDEWLKKEAVSPFDLSNAQSLRIKCLKTDGGNLLIATIHHIAADLWSLLIIAEDLFSDYQHYLAHGYFNVIKAEKTYQDHVLQQKIYLQSDDIEDVRLFWQEYLVNATFQLEMPTDFVRPAIMTMSTARRSTFVDNNIARSVREFCKKSAITPYVLFESAFQLLLFRYVQRSSFLIGTPTFGRSKQALEKIVGDFANPVVLRANIKRENGVVRWLKSNQKDLFKVMALQDYPFPSLVELINPPRDASRTPLFQHMFVWHQGNKDTFLQQNVIEDILPISGPCGSPYDILLSVSDMGDGFECHWTYQTSLYDDVSIKQFSREYEQVIYALLASKDEITIGSLLNEIESSSLDICGELTNNVFLKGKSLDSFVSDDRFDKTEIIDSKISVAGYSLTNISDEHPISCLHERGSVVRHYSDISEILPLNGYYNANGDIVITDISLGWGVINRELIDLKSKILEEYSYVSVPNIIVRCCISDDGGFRNVVYFESCGDETIDDDIGKYLESSYGFLQDVVCLSRFVLDDNGHIDRFWLLGIPVFGVSSIAKNNNKSDGITSKSIKRTQIRLAPQQYYPNKDADNNKEMVDVNSVEGVQLDVDELEPALLIGGKLSLTIPVDNIVEGLIKTAALNDGTGFRFVDEAGMVSTLSYTDLLHASVILANGLRQNGIQEKQVVILQLSDRSQYFTLWWALLWLGATPLTIAVPTGYSDDQPIAKKLKNVVRSIPDCVVISDVNSSGSVTLIEDYINCSVLHINDIVNVVGVGPLLVEESIQEKGYYKRNDIAFLQLTSGSTGTPKVIQISHQGILHQVYAAAEFNQFAVGDKTLNWLPYDHVVPILTTHLRDVILGLSQFQVSTLTVLADPLHWLQLMEKYDIQHSWSPNFGFKLVVDALKAAGTDKSLNQITSLCNVKTLMNAGEQVIPSVASDFMRLLQPFHLRAGAIQPAFGMAESCTCITYDNEYGFDGDDLMPFASLGGVIPGVDIRIVDGNNVLLNAGEIGRMQIRGPIVTAGYMNNHSANEESFVGDGWFNSGDLGYIFREKLVLTGREKEMIVIRGVNYYCYEIEESITLHTSILSTFVAAFSIRNDSNIEELIVVYVESDNVSSANSEKEINTIINTDFGIEARYIVRVRQDQFHKTTSGKIQRSQFRLLYEAGEYKAQCVAFDRVMGNVTEADLSIPYYLYQAELEKVDLALVEGFEGDDVSAIAFSFENRLVRKLGGYCSKMPVIEAKSVTDIALLSKPILMNAVRNRSTNILLLYSLPVVTDVEETQRLVITLTDTVLQLNRQFCQDKRICIDNEMALHVVLVKQPNTPDSNIVSMKSLTDSISQELTMGSVENNEGTASLLRLRIVNEHDISDSLFDKILQLRSVISPLTFDAGSVFRPVLQHAAISMRPSFKDGSQLSPIYRKVFVVTGGFGGLGIELVKYLLDEQCKIIVIGRKDISLCKKTQTLAKDIRREYGEKALSYHSVASLDEANIRFSVNSGLVSVEEESIDGIFHLAGRYLQKTASSMTDEDWTQCLDAKYEGSLTLGRYLRKSWPNAMLIYFSSINSYFGASGLTGYSTANALQNQLTDYFNKTENIEDEGVGIVKTFSLNWSVWPDIGMAQDFSSQDIALAKNKGFLPMSTANDLFWLDSVLASEPGCYWLGLDHKKPVIAADVGWKGVSEQWQISVLDAKSEALQMNQHIELPRIPLPVFNVVDVELKRGGQQPRNATDQLLLDIWVSLLGARVSHIDQTFFECGGNSVVVTQLMYKVTVNFSESLPLSSLFEYPTIRKFSDFLLSKKSSTEKGLEESGFSSVISALSLVDQVKNLGKDQVTLISGNIERPKSTIIYIPALIGLPHSYQHLLHEFSQCNQVLLSRDVLTQSDVSISQLASMYIDVLRKNDVDLVHCTLVGWSFGGCVAFEMMRQLEASRALLKKRKLIIIDSGIQDAIPLFLGDDTVAFSLFSKDLGQNAASIEGHSITASSGSVASKLDSLHAYLLGKSVDIETEVLGVWFNTYKNNMQLLREYKPGHQRVDGDVIYIKANGNALTTHDMGWGEQFLHFNVIDRDSDHQQVIYDSVLLESISGCLQDGGYENGAS
ncbi:hypothetical protein A9Q81_07840 [Gammaproteobacteria bacterium 42_54_T18]|nr:hypothetical protein A9Q81_07840 [Gammaproteobacteria bacterium 42_54_T18]